MKNGAPSATAILPARLRAAHQVLDDDPKILLDPIAVGFVDGASETEIRASAEDMRKPFLRELRSGFVLRSRFAEDALADAASELEQYVILGAGCETFAYRQPGWAKRLQIFEVDHPASQAWKRERLAQRGLSLPPNLELSPVDFERMSLTDALPPSFESRAGTFFSWLGVTQYLTDEAIDEVLAVIAALPSPSQVVFSFVPPGGALGERDAKLAAIASSLSGDQGEPWLSRLDPSELVDRLRRLGFKASFHLTPAIAKERYFEGRADGLSPRVLEQLMWARV